MGSRPAAYSTGKTKTQISTDFRVHAPQQTPFNEVLAEMVYRFNDLMDQALVQWGKDGDV